MGTVQSKYESKLNLVTLVNLRVRKTKTMLKYWLKSLKKEVLIDLAYIPCQLSAERRKGSGPIRLEALENLVE